MVELGRHLKRPARWPWAAAALLLLGGAVALPAAGESQAVIKALQGGGPQSKFPPPDEVFHFEATAAGPRAIRLDWGIRKGFYLYRSRLKVKATDATPLGPLTLPPGEVKMDPYFGREIIYRRSLLATGPVVRRSATGSLAVPLSVTYQGCADAGLCYPPITPPPRARRPPAPRPARSCPNRADSRASRAREVCWQ